MKKLIMLLLLGVMAFSLVACTAQVIIVTDLIKSDKPRETAPRVTENDLSLLVNSNTDFALSLYEVLKNDQDGNLFYSPYSISLMMAMAYAGAQGETSLQMGNALKFNLNPTELHRAFNYLALELAKRTGSDGDFKLHIVNDIWGQKEYKFLDAYLDTLAVNYGAGLRVLDFINDPEGARKTINDYIYEQTSQIIDELIPEGSINILTRLVLTNAIYFKAEWQHKFQKESTFDGPFYLIDGNSVTVPIMNQRSHFNYASGDGWQAIELPYQGETIAMTVLLPENFSMFENQLDADLLNSILQEMSKRDIQLGLPKFDFKSDFDLKAALTDLGMPVAFVPGQADFTGITTVEELYIQGILHKAYVAVDEEGTEAAAAGAVIIGTTSMPETMMVDRPFIFMIRDLETGTILFMGRVLDPSK